MNTLDTLEFDGLTHLARWLDSSAPAAGAGNSSARPASEGWDLGLGFDGAIEIARAGGAGWTEGAEQMQAGLVEAATMTRTAAVPNITHSVAGFLPDVPAYLANDPECMMHVETGEARSAAPIVSIAIGTVNAGTDAHHAMNRGVAVMTLVDVLESNGYQCEVTYCADKTGLAAAVQQRLRVKVKDAGSAWSPAKCAFIMAHPAMQRRLMFSVIERDAAWNPDTNSGYGHGVERLSVGEFDIQFGYLVGGRGFRTLAEGLSTAEALAQAAGFDVKLNTK